MSLPELYIPPPVQPLQVTAEMLFPEAADVYMRSRTFGVRTSRISARYIKSTTEKNYRTCIRSLSLFFGRLRLEQIEFGHLRGYQIARSSGAKPFIRRRRPHEDPRPCPTKPQAVNQELCLLRSIMRRAKVWNLDMDDLYEELQETESEVPRALSLEEERRWLEVSYSNERWRLIHWYSVLAFATCMGTNELRALRVGDVNLACRIVNVPAEGAKNRRRQRTIPLSSAESLWAADNLLRRAESLGAKDFQHYLFPFRDLRANRYVPTEPMTNSGIKRLWQEVRVASGLTHFRPYDTRHTGITRLAESGVPIAVIMAMAGHASRRMSEHYTHISSQAQAEAVRQAQESRLSPRLYYVAHKPAAGGSGCSLGGGLSVQPVYPDHEASLAVPGPARPVVPVLEPKSASGTMQFSVFLPDPAQRNT